MKHVDIQCGTINVPGGHSESIADLRPKYLGPAEANLGTRENSPTPETCHAQRRIYQFHNLNRRFTPNRTCCHPSRLNHNHRFCSRNCDSHHYRRRAFFLCDSRRVNLAGSGRTRPQHHRAWRPPDRVFLDRRASPACLSIRASRPGRQCPSLSPTGTRCCTLLMMDWREHKPPLTLR